MRPLLLLLIFATFSFAGKIVIDKDQSTIFFQVSNMWLNTVRGSFRKFDAEIIYDTKKHLISSCKASIPVASIFTDNDSRDEDLRSGNYFKADYYPQIAFEMNEIFNNHIVGYLTILDNTRPIALLIKKLEVQGNNFTLELEGDLNRNEYGLVKSSHFLIGKMVQFTVTLKGRLDGET